MPKHLREDFCGTALLASTWCRGDIARRTGMGLDIDRDALMWGMQHNGEGLADTAQPCLWLLHGDVTQPLDKALLVRCPASSSSNPGSQLSVEQSMQDLSIHATSAAVNGLNSSSSSSTQDEAAHPGRAPIREAVQSSKSNVDRDNCEMSSVAPSVSAPPTSRLQETPLHQVGHLQEEDLSGHSSQSNHSKADACKAADIICAFNFSVCLLHQRSEVQVMGRQTALPSVSADEILVCLQKLLDLHAVLEDCFALSAPGLMWQ